MASRTAKIASSIVAGILAGAPLTVPRDAAKAAECLTEPRQDAPRGQHWYFRTEQATKRHCWYLREEGGKVSHAAPSDDSVQAPKVAAQTSENSPGSLEDARAEYPMPQARETPATAPVPVLAPPASSPILSPPQADARDSTVAARWPSPETAAAPATLSAAADSADDPAPTTDAAPTPDAASATSAAPTPDAAPTDPATPAPVAASPMPARPSVSLQMLFAVIGGALALAGLTASVVYRFGRRRKKRRLDPRERRAAIWEGVDTAPKSTPPWVEPVIEQTAPRPSPERRAAQSATTQERYEKIEEILALLVKQAQESDA